MQRIDPDTAEILDVADFEYTKLMEEMTPLPREFSATWTEDDIFRTEVSSLALIELKKLMSSAPSHRCSYRSSRKR